MKKKIKAVAILLIVAILSTSVQTPVSAAYTNTNKSFTLKEGGFLGIGATTYTYKIYKENVSYYRMFHNLDVCPPIYHRKNSGTTSLTYSQSMTYTSQTAYTFSVASGLSANADVVTATAQKTSGIIKTKSLSISASGSVGKTIPSDANTGYYKMTICHNWDKYRLDKYNGSQYKTCYYAGIPTGNAYVAVLYGKTSNNSDYKKY